MQLDVLRLDIHCYQEARVTFLWLGIEDEGLRKKHMLNDFGFGKLSKLRPRMLRVRVCDPIHNLPNFDDVDSYFNS